ncbi:class I SAM-dependent methyltransferase [Goekera deserti]|uniref:Class I SAM-dependent methyltransferase n=1 Tax=Goekera deserti TaxID=2497753 RepID=A0A7K3WBY4_9ACTN|nr:class I SAM-dependent methyltransferase [Goekera deserti]NDI48229.1 methyltransferase domain-containing protein [Goekera deserti]NEL53978.1 class I SAM-dependent methyltransferase [Goekera deserti]
MSVDFAGDTSRLYARYRRDLPADQAAELAHLLGLSANDVLVDLGCGTGQLAVPLRRHCRAVLGLDPEPGMLTGLRARAAPGILTVLGADSDLPQLRSLLVSGQGAGAGAVVIGNALHWMDEPAALAAAGALLRTGGGVAVVTQGPPLWLGAEPWQAGVRAVLEQGRGQVRDTCGSDEAALHMRSDILRDQGLDVSITRWQATHQVDTEWVIGHLGSALPDGALQLDQPDGLAERLRASLVSQNGHLLEEVTTTALVGRRGRD